jgi:aryl-phospho-beta-D-glucosidase BglC (GH1 family)
MQQELIDFWVRAAREYADDPVVAAFDLLNEPKPPRDADWLAYASRTLKELRKAGWNRPVIVESSMLADGWTVDTRPFEDAAVIYDTHFYTPWSFTYSAKSKMGMPCVDYGRRVLDEAFLREHLQADLLAFAAKNKVPVNMGEFGVSDKALAAGGEKWLSIVLSILDEHQVHRQYFCWCVYGDFAVDPGWFRRSPSVRRENVLTLLKAHSPTIRKEP